MISKEELLESDFLDQFKTGEELDRFLKSVFNRGMEQILKGEMDNHLGYSKNDKKGDLSGNSRNGYSNKKLNSEFGEIDINVPRDRNGTFEPQIIPKRKKNRPGIETLIISLYAKGMTVSDIEQQLIEIYDINISTTAISTITDRVKQDAIEWQNRPLEEVYPIVWMDAIVFKVRDNSRVVNKAIYIAVGLNTSGYKEVLGLWLGKTESSSFWMSVLKY